MSLMRPNTDATVTICHSITKTLPDLIKQTDILVGAVGRPAFIEAQWIKDGAVVVDAGHHAGGLGDIERAPLVDRVRAYTGCPVELAP